MYTHAIGLNYTRAISGWLWTCFSVDFECSLTDPKC